MSVEIRCTPYAQSAEIQIEVHSTIYEQVPHFRPELVIEVGERGYENDYHKERMGYTGVVKEDGTTDVNISISFVAYPLHENTEYEINAYYVKGYNASPYYFIYEQAHINFSTWTVQTVGKQNDRVSEIPLTDKQINAKYLYNKIVKANKMTLESFCCLLGIMDCAGNLNPTANLCFGSFNGIDPENIYYSDPNRHYNFIYADEPFFIGIYGEDIRWVRGGILIGNKEDSTHVYIKQNGITYQDKNGYYSSPEYSFYDLSPWYYNSCDGLFEIYRYRDPDYGEYYKKAKAFTCLPFFHKDYTDYLYTAVTGLTDEKTLDLFRRREWLNIEMVYELVNYLIVSTASETHSDWWFCDDSEFFDMEAKYPTLGKFAKCKSTNIEKNAAFVFSCFKGGKFGTLAHNTLCPAQEPESGSGIKIVWRLYNLECVQKKSRYWYNYFKKRRHPWWMYIKWNI